MKNIIIPPVFVLISLILIIVFYFLIPDFNYIPFPFNLSGLALVFAGFGIMGTTRKLFQKHKTTLFIEKSSAFIQEGLFAKTRNPMYIGMFTLLFGIGICFGNLFSMITPLGFILMIRFYFIPKEEKLMLDAFGEEYLAYKKKVRRLI
jgi:protein-S-isoprenylcysteine O-methyltransferase Ste14